MSNFGVYVHKIQHPVQNHPNADRLSLIKIEGYTVISNRLSDGSHRYNQGDYVVYIPEQSILPNDLLIKIGRWKDAVPATDEKPEKLPKGSLNGPLGNRVKIIQLRGIYSQGLLYPVNFNNNNLHINLPSGLMVAVTYGQELSELMGITKWEPIVPMGMDGEVCSEPMASIKFDFESIQTLPDLFDTGMQVYATEKGHGTFMQFGLVSGMSNKECFCGGDIYVASKGLGNKGLSFKDNEENNKNLYVTMLRKELEGGLEERLRAMSAKLNNSSIRIFGEIIGKGVQDLHYGFDKPVLRIFDIAINNKFIRPELMEELASTLQLEKMPTLYKGPYDINELVKYRDGKDIFSGSHIREGIVIRAEDGSYHPDYGRRIGKMVSPDYLMRKNATEYN